jgi:hypothetical protein
MAITKTTEVVSIRYHAETTQPRGVQAEQQDVMFVDTLISYTDTDTNQTTTHLESSRLKVNSDISKESTVTQAIWNIIFGDSAEEQATAALAASAALAAANTVTNITTST